MYPVYGSAAYQDQEVEIVAAERREIEETPTPAWVKAAVKADRKRDEVMA